MNNGMQATLRALRDKGYKIRITHSRMTEHGLFPSREIREFNRTPSSHSMLFILPFGGKVECEILTPEGKRIQGEANCSERDNFQRSVGTAIAFGRALKQIKL